ncbi:AAA family ATPase [Luteibacter sp. PPL201]|uniref:AAA family ATPase n=1 Tax=Luteibacter sahnii TaxID=3021977 RepID=A0ABT6BCU5_9GAMM
MIYVGWDADRRVAALATDENVILLGLDRWDDFHYKTTFPTTCRINGSKVELEAIQILVAGEMVTSDHLDECIANGWDGIFPIPETAYVSVPAAMTFYEQLDGHLGHATTLSVAAALKDASYMVWIQDDDESRALTNTEGFRKSLQRERGAVTAYLNLWKFFSNAGISVGSFSFRFRTALGRINSLDLEFPPDSLLPHDIHVLIGPNGIGKSQALLQLVEHWLSTEPSMDAKVGFAETVNLNKVIVVSYSPFESFPLDTGDKGSRRDHGVYRYFGLRGFRKVFNEGGVGEEKIRLSQSRPKANAAESLVACVEDDQRYGAIRDWSAKVATMERVLRSAIDFDYAAVKVWNFPNEEVFFEDEHGVGEDAVITVPTSPNSSDDEFITYIPITADRVSALKPDFIRHHMHAGAGVVFLKGGKPIELSSGQRLFSYIVVNILGAIRRNSLVVIDEPELFLHPTLEIAFISMLKTILTSYRSKALLATHSLVTVRELPRDCVHVFERTENGIVVNRPPFETFGGDVQRISSYVFGDKSVSKPFESWIREKLLQFGSPEALIAALGDNINEEMIIQISAMGAGQW